MASRVDLIKVQMYVYVEFQGHHNIDFEYEPAADDPLVALAIAKHREIKKAEIEADIAAGKMPKEMFLL